MISDQEYGTFLSKMRMVQSPNSVENENDNNDNQLMRSLLYSHEIP